MANEVPGLDPETLRPARIWNYRLGGEDHFAVDRQDGDDILKAIPDMALFTRATRQFLRRAAPSARLVYVDNDPLVLAHARSLLDGMPEGRTDYLRDLEKILAGAAAPLDLEEPVALLLTGVLGHITDYDEARSLVGRLTDTLPSGSYLALYDATNVVDPASAEALTSSCAPRSSSKASSTTWNSSHPASSPVPCGTPAHRCRRRRPQTLRPGAVEPESRREAKLRRLQRYEFRDERRPLHRSPECPSGQGTEGW